MLIIKDHCDQCGTCVAVCPSDALSLGEFKVRVKQELCTQCGICVKICPIKALELKNEK
ncbi:MAG: 4Fe-4S binding protein [Candidatus Neomarinimicrobiota bacterium]|jgi:ferredoxin